MRHRKSGLKLNRTSSHRDAMFRNMVTSLFKYDRIRTTDAKARELKKWADHLITLAKRGDLHARRQALAIIREKAVVHNLFKEAGDRFGAVKGGYTRTFKLGTRPGDAARMTMVELIALETSKTKKKTKKKAKQVEEKEQIVETDTSEAADIDKDKTESSEAVKDEIEETKEIENDGLSEGKDTDDK